MLKPMIKKFVPEEARLDHTEDKCMVTLLGNVQVTQHKASAEITTERS